MNQGLREIFAARWDETFLIEAGSGNRWSYGQTLGLARTMDRRLAEAGVSAGDRVAIALENGAAFVAAYFGCLLRGAVAVPLHGQLSEADLAYILETTQPAVVMHGAGRKLPASWPLLEVGPAGSSEWAATRDEDLHAMGAVDAAAVFTVHFTSGTTGRPKGVCHTLAGLLESAGAFNEALQFDSRHRFLHLLPMAYMAGFLNTILCPLLAGGSVVISEVYHARTPLDFWAVPRRFEVNVLWIVPSMAAALVAVDKDAAGAGFCRENIERVCVGTAPLPLEVRRRFETKYGVPLLESYGLSETLFVATNSPARPAENGSVGRVLRGVHLRMVDGDGRDLPAGAEGDILVESPFTSPGYYGQPANAAGAFSSGDIGRLDAEGNLFITGRGKDLIIRGGVNVSPRAIEEVIAQRSDLISAVAVVGVAHDLKGEEIVAFLQPAATGRVGEIKDEISRHCRECLAPHQRPDRYLLVEEMPVGVSGKIQKHKLREQLLTGSLAP